MKLGCSYIAAAIIPVISAYFPPPPPPPFVARIGLPVKSFESFFSVFEPSTASQSSLLNPPVAKSVVSRVSIHMPRISTTVISQLAGETRALCRFVFFFDCILIR